MVMPVTAQLQMMDAHLYQYQMQKQQQMIEVSPVSRMTHSQRAVCCQLHEYFFQQSLESTSSGFAPRFHFIIIIIIYPLTVKVVWAPQMISQPVSSIIL